MNQAHKHLEPGSEYYDFIKNQVKLLVDRWNGSHIKSQVDPIFVAGEFKNVINYNHSITIDDIQQAIDRGMMGQYGENYSLNSETIYRWFNGWMKQKISENIKGAKAYKTSNQPEPSEKQKDAKRKVTRLALIDIFMKYHNEYLTTGEINHGIKQYYVIYLKWFRILGLVEISKEDEAKMYMQEAKNLMSLRSKKTSTGGQENNYILFLKIFKSLEGAKEIREKLRSIKI